MRLHLLFMVHFMKASPVRRFNPHSRSYVDSLEVVCLIWLGKLSLQINGRGKIAAARSICLLEENITKRQEEYKLNTLNEISYTAVSWFVNNIETNTRKIINVQMNNCIMLLWLENIIFYELRSVLGFDFFPHIFLGCVWIENVVGLLWVTQQRRVFLWDCDMCLNKEWSQRDSFNLSSHAFFPPPLNPGGTWLPNPACNESQEPVRAMRPALRLECKTRPTRTLLNSYFSYWSG